MRTLIIAIVILFSPACSSKKEPAGDDVYQTSVYRSSAAGEKFNLVDDSITASKPLAEMIIKAEDEFQTIRGFGGAFTEASAALYQGLDKTARKELIEAYFGPTGANYSFCRTHFNSCDFSLNSYAYDTVANDTALIHFSIEEDRNDLIPMIKAAQNASNEGFNLLASPWTAPPWMKDNRAWFAGKLKKEYYPTWANYFLKYYRAYQNEGIPIWGFTIENEPLGNDSNWESMHFTAREMGEFVSQHLGPLLNDSAPDLKLYLYDQNRDEELINWSKVLLNDSTVYQFAQGTAVHWYASTYDSFNDALDSIHDLAPNKEIIQSEACIDNDVPRWREDDWYWSMNATDWGYQWAREADKYLHPKYVPVHRYASDIINCLNHWVSGWIDWNMVLDKKGGPNHAENWCIAPVIVDSLNNEIYYTPLYYTMMHFSKFIRPGAKRIGFNLNDQTIKATACKNSDGSLVIVLFNPEKAGKQINLKIQESGFQKSVVLPANSLETILIKQNKENF